MFGTSAELPSKSNRPIPPPMLPRPTLSLAPLVALALAGALPFFAACSSSRSRLPKPNAEPTYLAPESRVLGRVLSHDTAARTVLVELAFYPDAPIPTENQVVATRHPDTLAATGKLAASRFRTGRVLGMRVVEGEPAVGDEVFSTPALALETTDSAKPADAAK